MNTPPTSPNPPAPGSTAAATGAGHRFFAAWARAVLRYRIPLLLLTVALTIGAVYQVRTSLKIETSFESFTSSKSEARLALNAFRATFGRDDVFLVVVEGDVFSMAYLNRLKALHVELEGLSLEGIEPLVIRAEPRKSAANPRPATLANPATVVAAGATGDADFGDFGDFGDDTVSGSAEKSGDPSKASAAPSAKTDAWGDEAGATLIDQVVSLITMRKTRMTDGALTVGELMDPMPTEATLARTKTEALAEPAVLGQVLGRALRHSLVVVRTLPLNEADSDRVFRELQQIAARHNRDDFACSVAGQPALTAWLKAAMMRDMRVLLGSAVLVMLLVLVFIFRHPVGVVGPIIVILMSVVWTVGMMATFGMPMTVMTTIMPSFLFAVGLGDAIHLVSVYRDLRRHGVANDAAIEQALATTGVPLVFTSLTTAMGLLSFNFAAVDALAQMGTAAAFGVGAALLHSTVFLPIVLSFNHKSLLGGRDVAGGDRLDRALWRITGLRTARLGQLTPARNRRVLGLAVAIALLSAWGISMIGVSHNPLKWLPSDLPIRAAFDTVDREVGGTTTAQLLITAKSARGIKDLAFLRGLEKLEQHILRFEDPDSGKIVGAAISVLDAVRETNKALHNADPAWYRLPDTQRGASDLLFLFESSGPAELRRMATADLRTTQMTVRIKWLDAHAYLPLAAYIRAGVAEHLGELADVRVTGSTFTLTATVAGLIDDTLRSLAAALLVITLFMILLLRDFRLGLVAMVPNLLPIAMILGFMGFMGIPIDMGNLMLASIGIGIAVDDTIHFLHHFRVGRAGGQSTEAAIAGAVQHAGRAMVGTTVVLTLGFAVFLAGSLVHLQRFGGLIAMTAVCALVVDLALTPALLRALYRDGKPG